MSEIVLKADALTSERDDRLLFQNLRLEFQIGEVIQIRGPNGSGKTTLLRRLAGLADIVEGDLYWQSGYGEDNWLDPSKYLYLGHKAGITGSASAIENLRFNHSLKDMEEPSVEDLYHALEKVGLKGFEYVLAHNLSAGQNRRVALARLYLKEQQVPIWILDEPFTALDVKGVAHLEQQIEKHAQSGGLVILTTHHPLNIPSARFVDLENFR